MIVIHSKAQNTFPSTGNAGIGVGTPAYPLTFGGVSGDKISFYSNSSNHYGIGIQSGLLQIHSDAAVSDIAFGWGKSSAFNEKMRIRGSGNVGIGTSTPAQRFSVISQNNSDTTKIAALFANNQTQGIGIGCNSIRAIGSSANVNMNFYSKGSGYFTFNTAKERLRITTAGDVGIGTASPKAKLHVFRGSAGNITANANATLVVENSTHNYIQLLAPGSSERGILFGDDGNAQDAGIVYVGSNNNMQFKTNGNVTRMVITDAGNVGIGTISPDDKLEVAGADPTIRIKNVNNEIGAYCGNTSYSMQLGLFNPNTSLSGMVSAETRRSFFGFDNNGMVGSLVNDFGPPVFRNILDDGNGNAGFGTIPSGVYRLTINGSGLASGGIWTNSDFKLKKNLNDCSNAMDIIKQLKPKTYFFKTDEYALLNLPAKKQYGFVAQELEKVLPDLVQTSREVVSIDAKNGRKMEDIKSVNYTALIPVLTKAIQEQQQQIEELKLMVEKLSQQVTLSNTVNDANTKITARLMDNQLDQNIPNPLTNTASISYSVSAGAKNVQLLITNNSGKTIKQLLLTAGKGAVNIDASTLSSGTYNYSLLVDGKILESKKMVVAR